ncbi:hypothetical protein [Roseobacter sp. GAI101]|uniref:hypothetical protein n=1 Tax=Roseobacter sp. (strain GAI101) TaxID=391589 RepID=UPI0001871775|nr:hypothetical protein [Roseobacter sp. GAI101]EEB84297.1 hypothetical protein RGAI101_1447 [Roseobacter sp. GAI101]
MFELIADRLAIRAKETAQTVAIGMGAFLCLVVGGLFLTVAAWLFLLTFMTTLQACLIIGSTFFGIGLILIFVMSVRAAARRRIRRQMMLDAAAARNAQLGSGVGGIAAIVIAFINGMNAGKGTRL